ncbi:Axonemal dynein light chain [Novymonas esmeraldas]|uniref:Axonemal dynein light chain n=1 Tax=Novymonas esmeraldas TaxID=1808958 RepID=A0AAW0F662_9TRYP
MAVPDGRSVYDVLGTVLYRTIPVALDADAPTQQQQQSQQQQQQQWGDFDVPLDYDAALALRERDELAMAARYIATTARGGAGAATSGVGGGGGGGAVASRDGTTAAADRVSSATAGHRPAAASAAAASSLHRPGGGRAPLPTTKALQRPRIGGSVSGNSLAITARSGVDASGQWDTTAADDIPAQNARVVKARLRAAAAAATKRIGGGGSSSATAGGARTPHSTGAVTVAQAIESLFPLEAVDGSSSSSDGSDNDDDAGTGAVGAVAAGTPTLWRRADVAHLSRLDVVLLYQHLQQRCACESARPRGVVCPNRERIYSDGLRELTRQLTLLCPERGLLLDELARSMRQSTETYDVLLDSASQYAVRKSTERDLHQHLFAEKATLESEVRRREHRVSEWRAKLAGLQKRFEEQQAADGVVHAEEIAYAKRANLQLVSEIKRLASEAEKAKEA